MKKKGSKELPAISTASLPDVILMILFFFMVSTTMREQEVLVTYTLPEATQIQKLEKKNLVSYIHIGKPVSYMQSQVGTAIQIQLNDAFKTADDIGNFIAAERDNMKEEDKPYMTTSIKADEKAPMGIIIDVKQALRRAEALKISYSAKDVK